MITASFKRFIAALTSVTSRPILAIDMEAIVLSGLTRPAVKETKDVYYASGLPYMCDVREAFKRVDNMWTEPSETSPGSLKIMALGTAIHSLAQNTLLIKQGVLWGAWRCKSCGVVVTDSFKPVLCTNTVTTTTLLGESTSDTCINRLKKQEERWEYQEVSLVCDKKNIRGRADGIVFIQDKWYVLEIKTVSDLAIEDTKYALIKDFKVVVPETFNTLPNQGHVDQASIYTGLLLNKIRDKTFPLPAETFGGALLMYASRGELKIRTFLIPPDTRAYTYYAGRIDTIDMLVKQKAPLNGAKKCSSRKSVYASSCPFVDKCFPRSGERKSAKRV